MIDANQLRIGSRVMYLNMLSTSNGILEEVILSPDMIVDAFERPKAYSPIRLTASFLEFVGFIKGVSGEYCKQIDKCIVLHIYEDGRYGFGGDSKQIEPAVTLTSHDNRIKYQHQLQNLYFALTGKELDMKVLTQ